MVRTPRGVLTMVKKKKLGINMRENANVYFLKKVHTLIHMCHIFKRALIIQMVGVIPIRWPMIIHNTNNRQLQLLTSPQI